MNKFEKKFFIKYIPDGWEIKNIIHTHIIDIFSKIFLFLAIAIIPVFLYYYSIRIQELIEFYYIEIFLILVYIKMIYDIFDWYNDVIIITQKGVVILNWSLFDDNIQAIEFDKIEALEADQSGIIDQIFSKGNLIIHKFGDVRITIENITDPNGAIDKIKNVMDEDLDDKKEVGDEKFDIIMDSLSSVVEDFLRKKEDEINNKKEINEKILEEARKYKKTIDLR